MLRGDRKRILMATVTPLASIFGSGFLIIVPVLERSLGALSIVGVSIVCALAWVVGTSVRHIVREVEPMIESGELDRTSRVLEKLSDVVIVIAYVISVALYLRIMAQYVVSYTGPESMPAAADVERIIATAAVVIIVVVGVLHGFGGLHTMERLALGAVLVLTVALGAALLINDVNSAVTGGLELPPVPDRSVLDVLLVLGGVLITVQGFETIRYLGTEYDAETRIQASRVAQVVAITIYIAFVAIATPLMGLGTDAGPDRDLVAITDRVLPLLTIPLVLGAVLSQFSAATADTVAAGGNLEGLRESLGGSRAYVLSGIAAVILLWTVGTFAIIAIASRAFAAYYSLQAVIALRTCKGLWRKLGYGLLALVLALIAAFAEPAG